MLHSAGSYLAKSRSSFLRNAFAVRFSSTQIQDVTPAKPQEETLSSFKFRPFLDFYDKLPHEFLAYNFNEKSEAFLKPSLVRNVQSQIVGCHQYKAAQFSRYMENFYKETDPKHFWAYGIPEVLKELNAQSGPITKFTLFFGYWLFLISKGIITIMDVEYYAAHSIIPIAIAYHFFYDEVANHILNRREVSYKRTQAVLDEPAAVYKSKIDYLNSEIDYNYVKLMLADIENEMLSIRKEIQYRENLKLKHDEFKKRLDYQVELTMIENNFETTLLRSWVLPQIDAGITPQLKKNALQQCLSVLQSKAASATA